MHGKSCWSELQKLIRKKIELYKCQEKVEILVQQHSKLQVVPRDDMYGWDDQTGVMSPERVHNSSVSKQADDITQQFTSWLKAMLSMICLHTNVAFGLFVATDHISLFALGKAYEEDLLKKLKQCYFHQASTRAKFEEDDKTERRAHIVWSERSAVQCRSVKK